MAPDKLNLKVFGGGLSIDEYRDHFQIRKNASYQNQINHSSGITFQIIQPKVRNRK